MAQLTAFSDRDITTRERLEDYAADALVTTAGGLTLHVAMVCDGAGGGEAGELAARLTARTILEYLEISADTSIPKLLVKAVEKANKVVYSELRGAGTSTVALAAVDVNDGPSGRMYLASVGNSRIYLMRDGHLVRLNIDHTLANEYVYAGQMSFSEAEHLENGDYVTRIIGINADVQVDIGFYAERGKSFVNTYRAFRIGQKGMLLKDGDTVLVASDGMFEISPEDGRAYLREEELLRHALDDDVEHAVRSLMRYAAARRPDDNTAISMLFVPSRARRPVRVSGGLTRRQKYGLGAAFSIIIVAAALLGVQTVASQAQNANLRSTEARIREIVLQLSSTPTASPTATATPSPTARPTLVAEDQVGFQYYRTQPSAPVFTHRLAFSPEINYLLVQGENNLANPNTNIVPANLYLQTGSMVDLQNVHDTQGEERIELVLYPLADLFSNTGDFRQGGVEVSLQQNPDIRFGAETLCIAAKQIAADLTKPDDTDKIALTCFTGNTSDCFYQFPGEDPTPMPVGQRVLLDLKKLELISTGPLVYEEVKTYFDTVFALTNSYEQVQCLNSALDTDGDQVWYPVDVCPDEAGTEATNGCPDQDLDTVPDAQDQCPDEAGPADNSGCPLPDIDGDSLNDVEDQCPFEAGPVDNGGCPQATPTPRSLYGGAPVEDFFVLREQERERSGREATTSAAFLLMVAFAGVLGVTTWNRRR